MTPNHVPQVNRIKYHIFFCPPRFGVVNGEQQSIEISLRRPEQNVN